jgi:hypothetical protein
MTDLYWFPEKRYGWGWGTPSRGEGWAVLTAFLVLIVAAVVVFPLHHGRLAFFGSMLILIGLPVDTALRHAAVMAMGPRAAVARL